MEMKGDLQAKTLSVPLKWRNNQKPCFKAAYTMAFHPPVCLALSFSPSMLQCIKSYPLVMCNKNETSGRPVLIAVETCGGKHNAVWRLQNVLSVLSFLPKAQNVLFFMSKVGPSFKLCRALTGYQFLLNSIALFFARRYSQALQDNLHWQISECVMWLSFRLKSEGKGRIKLKLCLTHEEPVSTENQIKEGKCFVRFTLFWKSIH